MPPGRLRARIIIFVDVRYIHYLLFGYWNGAQTRYVSATNGLGIAFFQQFVCHSSKAQQWSVRGVNFWEPHRWKQCDPGEALESRQAWHTKLGVYGCKQANAAYAGETESRVAAPATSYTGYRVEPIPSGLMAGLLRFPVLYPAEAQVSSTYHQSSAVS